MRAPKPPQQIRAQRTRRALLSAAKRVFAERGYEGATVDDIAEAAGCSKGAYYFHFATKEDALLALLAAWADGRRRELVEAAAGAKSAGTAAGALLEALLSPKAGRGQDRRLLLEFWAQAERSARVRRRLARADRECRRLLVDALARAQEAGALSGELAAETAGQLAMALSHGLVLRSSLGFLSRAGVQACVSSLTGLLGAGRALRRAG